MPNHTPAYISAMADHKAAAARYRHLRNIDNREVGEGA